MPIHRVTTESPELLKATSDFFLGSAKESLGCYSDIQRESHERKFSMKLLHMRLDGNEFVDQHYYCFVKTHYKKIIAGVLGKTYQLPKNAGTLGHTELLLIDPEHTQKGIGRQMMAHFEANLETDVDGFFSRVNKANQASIDFSQRVGYTLQGQSEEFPDMVEFYKDAQARAKT